MSRRPWSLQDSTESSRIIRSWDLKKHARSSSVSNPTEEKLTGLWPLDASGGRYSNNLHMLTSLYFLYW